MPTIIDANRSYFLLFFSIINLLYLVSSQVLPPDECRKGQLRTAPYTCIDCPDPCESCSTPTNCTKCVNGYIKLTQTETSCVKTCPIGMYADYERGLCGKCSNACSDCFGPTDSSCYTCNSGFVLIGTRCAEGICDKGQYYNESKQRCIRCPYQCDACISPTNCTTCKDGFYRDGAKCDRTCPAGKYPNKNNGGCEPCHDSCEECTDGGNIDCIKCQVGLLMRLDNTCRPPTDPCPDGYYANDELRQCSRCHPLCKTCTGGGIFDCVDCHTSGGWSLTPLDGDFEFSSVSHVLCVDTCLLYTSPSPRDGLLSRMPSSA
eukprot:TRINITY_DN27457_c0_g1_i2.p1 TRINITY_DN27457_c0_g1~~TRINITY_DN27457_c0_g1_i2.p1  ORF type:complete len:318 (+),score=32.56 TRINITY_DN27457_c0_g1_i2:143-1096(+)